MRTIIFIRRSSTDFGGIENQICRIARELASRQVLRPVLFTSDKTSLFARRFEEMGFPACEVPMGKADVLAGAARAVRILRRSDVALVQSHMFRESFFGRLLRRLHPEIPHVFRVHTYIDCSRIPSWKKNAYHLAGRLTAALVDRYVCISRCARGELVRRTGIAPHRISVVPNAVDGAGPPDLREKAQALPLRRRVAMVSNFLPRKGHDVLLRALALLKADGLELSVRLVGGEMTNNGRQGDGPFLRAFKAEAARLGLLGQLEFYGYARHIGEALSGFPVVVLPSDSEGLPNCLLEAMSLRKLVVASRVGGIPEFIEHGKNGLLHAPQDHRGLAGMLSAVFLSPSFVWESLRDRGYAAWSENYATDKVIERLVRVYEEMGAV
ncbi:MAG: glycosyltransferase family 4 protein [Endomicrobiales bacterium]